ncbi:protein of unknown function [Paraburkholderia dioscoreae]|uniref:Uncharacterized protein n=1 Tax=Paraburkholderia dioscoreae TaxID=2604047 RepID=A0A5Q4ZCK2_9BURK|nr:protein of unknown function [Paraburkholderia dioscoreae]
MFQQYDFAARVRVHRVPARLERREAFSAEALQGWFERVQLGGECVGEIGVGQRALQGGRHGAARLRRRSGVQRAHFGGEFVRALDVGADADHHRAGVFRAPRRFDQDAGQLVAFEQDVVRPLQRDLAGAGDRQRAQPVDQRDAHREAQTRESFERTRQHARHGKQQRIARLRIPRTATAAAPGSLQIRDPHDRPRQRAGLAWQRLDAGHQVGIGRAGFLDDFDRPIVRVRAEQGDGALTVDAPIGLGRSYGSGRRGSSGSVHGSYCSDSEAGEPTWTVHRPRLRYNGP